MTQLSHFVESVSVDGADFDTLQISTSGTGCTNTEVLRGDGTHATFSVKADKATSVSTNAPKVTFNQDQHRTLRLHIQYPEDNKRKQDASQFNWVPTLFSYFFSDSPGGNLVQETDVSISLPYELENFGVQGNVGSCKWDAGNVENSFKVDLNVGSIKTISTLTCANASLKVNVGSIHVDELTASNTVELKADVGEIQGLFKGYKSLDADTGVGSLDLTLHPSSPFSDTSLSCGTGSIAAKVFGFHGKFNAKTGLGGLRVSGHAGDGPFRSLGAANFNGWVARKNVAGGSFGIHAGLGSATIDFHP
ncbi:hypothetical protein HDU81_000650 [Chytriomyces hyalinus]|nr:hypothetical protein HDU81_000650 [Chytriomyces hyalinus]